MHKLQDKVLGLLIIATASGIASGVIVEVVQRLTGDYVWLKILPGLLFGAGLVLAGRFPRGRPLLVPAYRAAAWYPAAAAFLLLCTISYYASQLAVVYLIQWRFHSTEAGVLALVGVIGGIPGSLGFALSLALLYPAFRSSSAIWKITMTGMAVGVFLTLANDLRIFGVYLFILIWQICLAFLLGFTESNWEDEELRRQLLGAGQE